jgi:hypothetical protein
VTASPYNFYILIEIIITLELQNSLMLILILSFKDFITFNYDYKMKEIQSIISLEIDHIELFHIVLVEKKIFVNRKIKQRA